MDALALVAEEGRGSLRKASGSRDQTQYPGMSEWGNPNIRRAEYIGAREGTARTETSK